MNSITNNIMKRIHAKRRGWVFAPKDFMDLGSRAAVDQVLSRLVKQGKVRRLGRGLYDYPKQHTLLGNLSPDTDSIAKVVAAKSSNTVFPSGAMSANLLGLSTQVPAKPVYLTNGRSRIKKIAGHTITFKHARVPFLDQLSDKANYLIQALLYFGAAGIDNDIIRRCVSQMDTRDIKSLSGAASLVPGWISDIIQKMQRADNGTVRQTT